MAIDIFLDAPAPAFCCFERPTFIGTNQYSTYYCRIDDSDLHAQVILGTHPDGYVVVSGDYLVFDIRAELSPIGVYKFGVDLKFLGGPYLSDRDTLDDLGNKSADEDRSPFFLDWYHADVSLEPFVGMTLDKIVAFVDSDDPGEYRFALRGVYITNGGSVQKTIFDGQVTGLPTSEGGIHYESSNEGATGVPIEPLNFNVSLFDDGGPPSFGIPREVMSGTSDTILTTDVAVINRSNDGDMTFNLPDAGTVPIGHIYIFFNQSTADDLIIDPFSLQLIDNVSTLTIAPNASAGVMRTAGLGGPAWLSF